MTLASTSLLQLFWSILAYMQARGAEVRIRKRRSEMIKSEVEAAIGKMNKDYKAAVQMILRLNKIMKILEEFRIK